MKLWLFVAAALVAGGLTPIQGSINAQVGTILGHPLRGTFVNFVTGTVILLIALTAVVGVPSRANLTAMPGYLYLGGLIGVIFVTVLLALIPEIGALRVLAAAVVGQLIVSAVIDHFGFLNVPIHSLSTSRVLGLGFLLAGLYLIQR